MMAHHIITSWLILDSFLTGYYRIGAIVLILLDICDVFLELGKMVDWMGATLPKVVMFTCLVVSWLGFRLIIYPYKVLYTIWAEATVIHDLEGHVWLMRDWYKWFGGLFALYLMQIFWGYLIFHAAYRVISTGNFRELKDSREIDEKRNRERIAAEKKKNDKLASQNKKTKATSQTQSTKPTPQTQNKIANSNKSSKPVQKALNPKQSEQKNAQKKKK